MIGGAIPYNETLSPNLKGWWFPTQWGIQVNDGAGAGNGAVGAEDYSGNGHHLLNPYAGATQLNTASSAQGFRPNTINSHLIHKASGTYDPLHFTKAGRSSFYSFWLYFDTVPASGARTILSTAGNNTELFSTDYYKGWMIRINFAASVGTFQCMSRDNAGGHNDAATTISTAGFHHFAVAIDVVAKTLTYWIDGTVDGTVDGADITSQIGTRENAPFMIGGNGLKDTDVRAAVNGSSSWAETSLNNLQVYSTDDAAGLPADIADLAGYLATHHGRALTQGQWA